MRMSNAAVIAAAARRLAAVKIVAMMVVGVAVVRARVRTLARRVRVRVVVVAVSAASTPIVHRWMLLAYRAAALAMAIAAPITALRGAVTSRCRIAFALLMRDVATVPSPGMVAA